MKQKLLFLYLKTGGGHLAPAKAIAAYLQRNHGGEVETVLADGFAEANGLMKSIIEGGYRFSQNNARWLFEGLYALNKIHFLCKLTASFLSIFSKKYIEKLITQEEPDKIVMFHSFLIKPVLDLLDELNLKIPTITAVIDPYTVPPIWLLRKNTYFIVFSKKSRQYVLNKKIPDHSVSVFPFVLNEKFSARIPASQLLPLREKLGFSKNIRTILVLGGGDGIPKGEAILKSLLKSGIEAEIALVCGKNKRLRKKAEKLKGEYFHRSVKIYGFVDFVYELISISDVVITKCGPSTIMEILFLGKIPIINSYIWEQEKGNAQFVMSSQMGFYEPKTKRLPSLINNIFSDEKLYLSLKENIEETSLENGIEKVSNFILHFQPNNA